MEKESTATKLKYIMQTRNMRQIDILNACQPYCEKYHVKMNKSDISQYVSGKFEPNQHKLFILAQALSVNVAWLMGFSVPMTPSEILVEQKTLSNLNTIEQQIIYNYRKSDNITKEMVHRTLGIDTKVELGKNLA